jgi:hypothetical protein
MKTNDLSIKEFSIDEEEMAIDFSIEYNYLFHQKSMEVKAENAGIPWTGSREDIKIMEESSRRVGKYCRMVYYPNNIICIIENKYARSIVLPWRIVYGKESLADKKWRINQYGNKNYIEILQQDGYLKEDWTIGDFLNDKS